MLLAVFRSFHFRLEHGSGVYGLAAGVFSGCLSVALAEVLNVFPVLFRRMGIKTGLEILITFFAFGKVAGGLVYFFCVAG